MLGDLGKLIVAKGFKTLPKVQKIARSGHTASHSLAWAWTILRLFLSSKGLNLFLKTFYFVKILKLL